jgi:hypothetical protein
MVASVTNVAGEVAAIHRTFLSPDGRKAAIDPNKMALGPCRGSALHLAPAVSTLVIAEGIETAMSILQSTGKPTWATLGTSGLKALELPEVVREVIIAAYGDKAGLKAAHAAALHFIQLSRNVRIALPPADSDFNDLLKTG